MIRLQALLFVAACAAAVFAQETSYQGQTWVGLLVADDCRAAGRSAATREADLTTTNRTTTPAVDRSGTRGAQDATATPPAGSKRDVPHTGDIQTAIPKGVVDPGWQKARKQAGALGSACRVQMETRRFALLLPDGSVLRFGDLANEAVHKQLPAMSAGGKIFRVQVTGKLQNGTIALDSIRL